MRNKDYFQIKDFALSLVLRKGQEATRKWPICHVIDVFSLVDLMVLMTFFSADQNEFAVSVCEIDFEMVQNDFALNRNGFAVPRILCRKENDLP